MPATQLYFFWCSSRKSFTSNHGTRVCCNLCENMDMAAEPWWDARKQGAVCSKLLIIKNQEMINTSSEKIIWENCTKSYQDRTGRIKTGSKNDNSLIIHTWKKDLAILSAWQTIQKPVFRVTEEIDFLFILFQLTFLIWALLNMHKREVEVCVCIDLHKCE